MDRAVTFLTRLIAVVAAVGTGLSWLNEHGSPEAVVFCGGALFGLPLCWIIFRKLDRQSFTDPVAFFLLLATSAVVGIGGTLAADAGDPVYLYAYAALGALPTFWVWDMVEKERHEQKHKQCPDCCETVKAKARVCRFCGYEFRPREVT